MNLRQVLITLAVGIAVGAAGAVYLPGAAQRYLPDSIAGKRTVVKGMVAGKEKKGAALLLSVNTPQGALLATITRKAEETDLLLGAGDAVELRIKDYQPFIEDPTVLRVVKRGQPASEGQETAAGNPSTTQTGTGEAKPVAGPGKSVTTAPAKKGRP